MSILAGDKYKGVLLVNDELTKFVVKVIEIRSGNSTDVLNGINPIGINYSVAVELSINGKPAEIYNNATLTYLYDTTKPFPSSLQLTGDNKDYVITGVVTSGGKRKSRKTISRSRYRRRLSRKRD